MTREEIAKELAVACLGHDKFVAHFDPEGNKKPDARDAGERVGEFYNAILKALEEKASSAPGPKVHQF
jgi:hypothetical protein